MNIGIISITIIVYLHITNTCPYIYMQSYTYILPIAGLPQKTPFDLIQPQHNYKYNHAHNGKWLALHNAHLKCCDA